MIAFLRSLLFSLILVVWTIIIGTIGMPTLIFKDSFLPTIISKFWSRGVLLFLHLLVGIKVKIIGKELLPKSGGYIVASKHQSALETIIFNVLFDQPLFILKKSLFFVPILGLYFWSIGMIFIDRQKASSTIKKIISGTQKGIKRGKVVLIFPEGTRSKPGHHANYKSSIFALYQNCKTSIVPVALNTGVYWGKNSFIKKPGIVYIEILKPIKPGLDKEKFMAVLFDKIESASMKLLEK